MPPHTQSLSHSLFVSASFTLTLCQSDDLSISFPYRFLFHCRILHIVSGPVGVLAKLVKWNLMGCDKWERDRERKRVRVRERLPKCRVNCNSIVDKQNEQSKRQTCRTNSQKSLPQIAESPLGNAYAKCSCVCDCECVCVCVWHGYLLPAGRVSQMPLTPSVSCHSNAKPWDSWILNPESLQTREKRNQQS